MMLQQGENVATTEVPTEYIHGNCILLQQKIIAINDVTTTKIIQLNNTTTNKNCCIYIYSVGVPRNRVPIK
jgi:hypothetical protein